MATTTFDKRIELDETAVDRLIEILENPPPKSPKSDARLLNGEETVEWLSSHWGHLLTRDTEKRS
jgi:hypothetical protein